ncbi:MAG: chromate efflux transporter [Bacteroidetes bacterium]|nr:chromate efflux transporter [Bacteroidota bacterium]
MNKVSFKEALLFWLKLGFISFGGPAGQIAIMHEYLVEKKKWISESKFLHALNYCMLLPGPEAQQLATYMGWLMHGVWGGVVAGLLFIIPSIFILLGLSIAYVTYGNTYFAQAIFYGIKPAVVAIVLLAVIKIGQKALKTKVDYAVAVLSLCALLFFKIPYPLLILSVIIFGLFYQQFSKNKNEKESSSPISFNKKLRNRTIIYTLVFFSLWLIPFVGVSYVSTFFSKMSLFFTQSALVTFGGAYSVLVYVSQHAVEKLHWLTQSQMVDGLALGETTPGPLIMVLSYVGFIGAYNEFHQNIFAGTVGLLITTYFTFLPSFAFILIGAPVVEMTQENKTIKQVLGFVTAAVVGVVANLFLFTLGSIYFPVSEDSLSHADLFPLIWIAISAIAIKKFNANMIAWILVSGVIGYLLMLVGYLPSGV